jgi:hypothetical protein
VLGGLALLEQREHLEPQTLAAGLAQTLEQRGLAVLLVLGEAMSSSLPKRLLVLELLLVKERMAPLATQEILGIASQETLAIIQVVTIQGVTTQAVMLQVITQEETLQVIIQGVTTHLVTFIILRTIRMPTVNTIQVVHALHTTQVITTRATNM